MLGLARGQASWICWPCHITTRKRHLRKVHHELVESEDGEQAGEDIEEEQDDANDGDQEVPLESEDSADEAMLVRPPAKRECQASSPGPGKGDSKNALHQCTETEPTRRGNRSNKADEATVMHIESPNE